MDFKKWAKSNRLKVIGYKGMGYKGMGYKGMGYKVMARQQIGYEY